MPSLGELTVALGAVTGPLNKGLAEARGELRSTETSMRSVVNTAGKLGLAAVAAGAAVVAGLVKSGLRAIDVQAKTARAVAGTIDGLRGLQIAAGDYGINQDELNKSMEMFTQRLGQAQRQGGPAAEMLKQLGLNAAELGRMDVDQRMAAIADRVRMLGLSTEQTADLLRQFGIRSAEMADMLRQGGDAIRAARQDVDDFGISLSEVDARKVEMANDAMSRIGLVIEGIRNQLTVAVAPILQEIAERFNTAARANKGWGDTARSVIESSIRGFGKVLDVIHGLRVTIKAAQLVAEGFGAAFVSAGQLILEIMFGVTDGINKAINFGIRAVNKLGASIDEIPMWEDSEFVAGMRRFADGSRDRIGMVRGELHDLAMMELPSARFEKFLDAVAARSQDAAENLERMQGALGTGAEGFGVEEKSEDDREAKKLELLREQLANRVQHIAESLLDEEELVQHHYERDLELLREAEEQKIFTEEEFQILRQQMEEDHMEKLKMIREKGMTDMERFMAASFTRQAQMTTAGIAQMTASLSSGSKTMFEINKKAGMANASISMFEGIAAGLKLGWPMAVPAVAYAAATGLAQLANLRSQQFGSGGGPSATIGASSAVPTAPSGGGGNGGGGGSDQQQVVRIQGIDPNQMFSGRQIVDLFNSAVKDGAKVVLEQ